MNMHTTVIVKNMFYNEEKKKNDIHRKSFHCENFFKLILLVHQVDTVSAFVVQQFLRKEVH